MKSSAINHLTVFVLLLSFTLQAQFTVTEVTPSRHSLSASINHQIIIKFTEPLNTLSITDTSFSVYGRWSGVHNGTLSFQNNNKTLLFESNKNFNAGEMVTVSLSKHVKSESNESLGAGYSYGFWVKSAGGTIDLSESERISVRTRLEEWIQTYGAFAGDLNNDGFTDFTVPNEVTNDIRIFLNDGKGSYSEFKKYTIQEGARPSTNEGADFNMDGHIDFAVGNSTNDKVTVFYGDGTGSFPIKGNFTVGQGVRGLSVLDLNCDGFADIATANRDASSVSILLNDNSGHFLASTSFDTQSNGETAAAAMDANNDGITDLFVGSLMSRELILLLGDGDGNLNLSSKVDAGGNPWMIAAGDIDGDGNADVVSANSSTHNFSVSRGDGIGNLTSSEVYKSGNFPLAIDLGDLDGDEDLDLVLSNYSSKNFEIYENDGAGNFTLAKTFFTNGAGSCAVLHDRDNDGDLDITGIDEIDDQLILFSNNIVDITSVESENTIQEFQLFQNYPNPFNPTTNIRYSVPVVTLSPAGQDKLRKVQHVTLKIYDTLGREVATLVNKPQSPGNYSVQWNGSGYVSGLYFYGLAHGTKQIMKKMLLIK